MTLKKPVVYEILRWGSAVLVLALILSFALKNKQSKASPADVLAAVSAEVDMSAMQEADAQMVKRLYGLNPQDYESCTLYYPTSNMGAEELLLIKLKDVSQQEQAVEAVEKRLDAQKKAFDGYGPAQFDLLSSHAVTEARGNYILFVVSENADAAKAAFLAAL